MINGYISPEDLEELVAKKLSSLGITNDDYPINPFELIENEGIILVKQRFNDANIKGMLVNGPERSGIILNNNRCVQSMKFAGMHELSHFWHHPKQDQRVCFDTYSMDYKGMEWQANNAASYALMPRDVIIDLYDYCYGNLEYIARFLDVSKEALSYRIKDIELPKIHPIFVCNFGFVQ